MTADDLRHRQLTTTQAASVFHFLRAKYEDDPAKLRHIEALWDSLGMFRPDAGLTD